MDGLCWTLIIQNSDMEHACLAKEMAHLNLFVFLNLCKGVCMDSKAPNCILFLVIIVCNRYVCYFCGLLLY
jgi:hypothetical protein